MSEVLNVPSPAYLPPANVYDELGRGQMPAHWRQIIDYFANQQANQQGHVEPEQIRREMLVRDLDITRPWPLDAVPFVLPDHEWQALETGLVQRTQLLNSVLSDLYGPRKLLSAGGLPPALVYGNPRFLLPLFDYQAEGKNYLSFAAFDVGRGPDGQWRVLADWTEAPQGLGMCLENRLLASQTLPELQQQFNIQRLRDFFHAFAQRFQFIAQHSGRDGLSVIQSPGPEHPSYFEHVYLGQYFGYPVVEGADLTVRGNALQMKTLEGLKPVSAVWRQTQSDLCDPLYLQAQSQYGSAGLVNAARQGRVHIVNSLGAGVLENDAFMSFLPSLAQTLLGEDLQLPSLPTWWCGQESAAQYAAQHADRLDFTSAFQRTELFGSRVSDYQSCAPASAELDHLQVAREPIQLSHAPYLNEAGELSSGPTVLRLFVACLEEGYRLLPGGIARVATPGGEISKDIWVADGVLTPLRTEFQPSRQQRRSDRDLPSRTADDLFWLGRYLERCEGAARTYRALFRRLSEQGADERRETTRTLLDLLVHLDMIQVSEARSLQDRINQPGGFGSLIFDSNSNDGIGRLLDNIQHLASQVRERLSADAWRMFTALATTPDRNRWRLATSTEAAAFFDRLLERLSALSGQMQENMTRSYGWRLLELGRRLERAQFGVHMLEELVSQSSQRMDLYLLLDLSDSVITYRSRYQNLPDLDTVLELLLMDTVNPRSLIYQVQRLQDVMQEMPLDQHADGLSDSRRILLNAYHELLLADPAKLATVISKAGNRTQLRRVLQRLETSLNSLSMLVNDTYFSHTGSSGQRR